MSRDAANRAALARIYSVRPQWQAVVSAKDTIGLPEFTLLHAGPPYRDARDPAPPVLSSAVLCCLHEAWAATESEAERLIKSGAVKLISAQSFGVVTPLAAVISPTTPLVEIVDAKDPTRRAWSLLGSGAGPQIRFGSRDRAVLQRMTWRDRVLAPALAAALEAHPISLLPLAASGLAGGDDLHANTAAATAALRRELTSSELAGSALPGEVDTMLAESPSFFLTLWMAACHLMMDAAACEGTHSTLVVALAGNGRALGVRLAGNASQWSTCPAAAPRGTRLNPASPAVAAPLTGDSGVIDAAGFGAHAFSLTPELAQIFEPWLPRAWREEQPPLLAGVRPAFRTLRCALDAASIVARRVEPLAAIAMIDAAGREGLLGRGLYAAPVALFEAALENLDTAAQNAGRPC